MESHLCVESSVPSRKLYIAERGLKDFSHHDVHAAWFGAQKFEQSSEGVWSGLAL